MLNDLLDSLNTINTQTSNHGWILLLILALLWIIFFIGHFIFPNMLRLGIIPRRFNGLFGILFAPLLHADFNHLFFNSIPLVVLSNFILMNGVVYYLYVTLIISCLSGFAIWCIGKPGLYVGASALITGYWSFLLVNTYQHMTLTSVILALLSLYYFAGIFFGIFPQGKNIAWQGHLLGLLAGVVTAWLVPLV